MFFVVMIENQRHMSAHGGQAQAILILAEEKIHEDRGGAIAPSGGVYE